MRVTHSVLFITLLAFAHRALADVVTGIPDAAPPGFEEWTSPIVLPSKNVTGDGSWGSAVARARAFVAQLTLDEKINVTTGVDVEERCVGQTGTIPRLNWNGLCLEDSPLGVRFADLVSAFPTGINTAATWDKTLMYQRGNAMGMEHKGKGVNVALGPMTNLGRDAAAGRNWEGFGADPFLAGVATAQTITGYQDAGVIATVKHYIANEQEHFRGGSESPQIYSSNLDDKTIHELYSWPFAEAVAAGVGAVMCSYNKINQTQACQNSKILNGILKEELDFQGFVVSDWAATINGVQPALAGLDMNMPGFKAYSQGPQDEENPDNTTNSWWGSALIQAVQNGSVPEWRVDDMVTRTFASWYKMGQDRNYPPVSFSQLTQDTFLNGQLVNEHINVQDDHYQLIREIGSASVILLKNEGALPLNVNNIKRIGIFGSDAGPNLDGPNGCQNGNADRGCSQGTLAMGWGSGTAQFPYLIDPAAAIGFYMNQHKPQVPVEAVLDDFNLAEVTTVASVADTCLVFANADSGEGYLNISGNAGDRNNLTLWHGGYQLIETTAASCANTIVVMHIVGPVLVEAWVDHPNITAVVHAGLPGQESGNGLVDVLFGSVSPSGRLPYTMAKQRSDYPADVLYESDMDTPQITYSEGVNIDYRHFDANGIEPRFEFGYGLSYTNFTYSGLNIAGGVHARVLPSVSVSGSGSAASAIPVPTTASAASSFSATASATGLPAPTSVASGSASGSAPSLSSAASITLSPSFSVSGSASFNVSSLSANATMNATATGSAPAAISSPAQNNPGGPAALFDTVFTVSFNVRNSGHVAGNEVSQVYLGFPSSAGEPPKILRGFERTFITQGASARVSIPLRRKDVSIWDVPSQTWVVPRGNFQVFVGASSRDIRLTGSFNV